MDPGRRDLPLARIALGAGAACLLLPEAAFADNCGDLTDCYGTARAALAALAGLALLFGVLVSTTLDFLPVVGTVKGLIELFTGKDLVTGQELTWWQRALGIVPVLGHAAGAAVLWRSMRALDEAGGLERAAARSLGGEEDVAALTERVRARVAADPDKFKLTYSDAEMAEIARKGKALGLSHKVVEDMVYVGSREAKAIPARDLVQQMSNWATEVKPRGFPYKFSDLAEFNRFGKDLVGNVKKAGLPTDDIRVQGSSLRRPAADDVDLAVFVDEGRFDKLLVNRFHQRISLKSGEKIALEGKTHEELMGIVRDIEANPGNYNATARTFQNAMSKGFISSKSDISRPLKRAAHDVADKYPDKGIQAISVEIKGGRFDLEPTMQVPR